MNRLLNKPLIGACIACMLLCTPICNAQSWYTVLPGDTFARLARANDLTVSELTAANEGVVSPIAPGVRIWIPAANQLLVSVDKVVWRGETHEVAAGETWYGIARQYGITDQELKAANGHVSETLGIGDRLQVPTTVPADSPVNALSDSTQLVMPQGSAEMGSDESHQHPVLPSDTLRVLAMLPFMLEVDTVMGGDYDAKTKRLRDVSLDFYHGMEWAAQLLQDSGYAVTVNVVDTEPDTLGVFSWSEDDLKASNVVLGPLRSNRMDSVNQMLSGSDTPQWILTPVKPAVWAHHAHSFSLRSDNRDGMRKLGAFVAQAHPKDTVLLLETRGRDAALEQSFKEGFFGVRGSFEGLEVAAANRQFAEGFTARMDTSKLNVVAIPSGKSSQSMIAYVQTELQLADSFPVRVYANPETAELEFMERDFMNRSNWTVPVSDRIDWNNPAVQAQTMRFREMYGTDPGPYSIVAFDAMIESARWMDSAGQLDAAPEPIQYQTEWIWDEPAARLVNANWHLRMFSDGEWARLITD